MTFRELVEQVRPDSGGVRVFGDPYETADGTTIVTAARVSGSGSAEAGAVMATPLGVFAIRDGKAEWTPAVDATRVALMGEFIGLAAVVMIMATLFRRPPWPDLSARVMTTLGRRTCR
ncbi:hypothetical protein [Nocardia sp. NPDC050710]|uniref:hypothetical protein n=1 Tax=Nocardia sp. NPDC050710 TaxID=3157220 RepID=UPI0033C3D091